MNPEFSTKKYKILFSNSFNIYTEENDKILKIKLDDFTFEFQFINNREKGTTIEYEGDEETRIAKIRVYNFKNPLGSSTTSPIAIFRMNDGESIYFSVFGQAIQDCLNTTITIFSEQTT